MISQVKFFVQEWKLLMKTSTLSHSLEKERYTVFTQRFSSSLLSNTSKKYLFYSRLVIINWPFYKVTPQVSELFKKKC